MKKVILAGFGQPLIDLYEGLKNQFFILGVILDYERREKYLRFHEFLANESIAVYSFEDAQSLNVVLKR